MMLPQLIVRNSIDGTHRDIKFLRQFCGAPEIAMCGSCKNMADFSNLIGRQFSRWITFAVFGVLLFVTIPANDFQIVWFIIFAIAIFVMDVNISAISCHTAPFAFGSTRSQRSAPISTDSGLECRICWSLWMPAVIAVSTMRAALHSILAFFARLANFTSGFVLMRFSEESIERARLSIALRLGWITMAFEPCPQSSFFYSQNQSGRRKIATLRIVEFFEPFFINCFQNDSSHGRNIDQAMTGVNKKGGCLDEDFS